MKTFRSFLSEDCRPEAHVENGSVDITDEKFREKLNVHLDNATARGFITPYAALEAVSAVLSVFHIFIPKTTLEGDHGVETWPVRQFGQVMGMNDQGEVETKPASEFNIYFEYQTNDTGWFKVFCEIVTASELEELLDDVESEINEELLAEAKMTAQEKRVMLNTIRAAQRFGKNLKPEKVKQLTPKQRTNKLDREEKLATQSYHAVAAQMPKTPKPPESSYEHLWKKSLASPRSHYDVQNLHKFYQMAKAEHKAASMDPDKITSGFKDYARRQRELGDAFAIWAEGSNFETIMDHIKAGHVPVTSRMLEAAARHAKKSDSIEGTTSRIEKINALSAKTFGTVTQKKLFGLIKKEKPKVSFG